MTPHDVEILIDLILTGWACGLVAALHAVLAWYVAPGYPTEPGQLEPGATREEIEELIRVAMRVLPYGVSVPPVSPMRHSAKCTASVPDRARPSEITRPAKVRRAVCHPLPSLSMRSDLTSGAIITQARARRCAVFTEGAIPSKLRPVGAVRNPGAVESSHVGAVSATAATIPAIPSVAHRVQ